MKLAWVISETLQLPPKYHSTMLHDLAPIWGSWRVWRSYQCDNCVCGDQLESQYCIENQYNQYCNLYVPDTIDVKEPNIFRYGSQGQLPTANRNDIIAMHLAGSRCDLVLLLGFQYKVHKAIIDGVVSNNPDTQWVLVTDVQETIDNRENFTCDKLDNVLKLLN
jgi:hypothetical protein